jgi:hypothetical protein
VATATTTTVVTRTHGRKRTVKRSKLNPIEARLAGLTGDPKGSKFDSAYFDSICQSLISNQLLVEDVRGVMHAIEDIQQDAHTAEQEILQRDGVGTELEAAQQMTKRVHHIVSTLEEIFFLAIDVANLRSAYMASELLYQQVDE